MSTGTHIKDKIKRFDSRNRRDTCTYYRYHSGGCLVHKIMSCNRCLKYKKKGIQL